MTVLEKFNEGDTRALSKVISFVENCEDGYRELLGKLYLRAGCSLRLGLTGPPGAGKSTLVNRLAHEHIRHGARVGIIAVDPTSPFTGGALLGDRVRMNEFPENSPVYFRSMATRGATGGLAAATDNVAVVMDAFGFDVVLIETVGVGQVELEVVDACDTVVVVVVPESGDAVQTMKAGLMEIADIMVVNKADRPGSERIVGELRGAMQMRKKTTGGWDVPVVATEALNNKNIDTLFEKMADHVKHKRQSGKFENDRHDQIRKKVLHILKTRFENEFIDRLGDGSEFDRLIGEVYQGLSDPYAVGEKLYRRFAEK